MDFVDLHRCFAPIHKSQEAALDVGRHWGRRLAGWLDWSELLKKRRVVLLAEASSGKSEEFRYRQQRLAAEGKFAFFVRIEDLSDRGLDASLGPDDSDRLSAWKADTVEGYFFLDSVDEARLNRKSFETALRCLARELGDHLDHAHLHISCRVSDWRGGPDRDSIARHLPVPPPAPPLAPEPEVALLSPIFERREKQAEKSKASDNPDALLVVQLIPLDTEQRRTLAQAAGIIDTDAFMAAIDQRGLEMLAERPGDLLDLIEYWRTQGRFGSLAEMTEHAISRRLAERDKYRPDNDSLTADQARKGAERIAAALTLGQVCTVKAPAQDIDPTLAGGALDADHILPDLKESKRNALLRRPCFAPSTYGRIRFHHRGTQEVLTASWFSGLLRAGCPKDEVWPLFFADRYGVETVIPSMRAAAAWLALKHPDFMDEVIRREPLLLIQNGDPGSVPLHAKKKLLSIYATRHGTGDIAEDHMDHRATWMFAEPELADAIRQAWAANSRQDFRRDLLRMVREARIAACADLAREALNNRQSEEYTRTVALAALASCEDDKALAAAAAELVRTPERYTPHVAAQFSRLLFPKYLSVAQLLDVIEKSQRTRGDSLDGFPAALDHLYRTCPDNASRDELLAGLSALALRRPYIQDYKHISRDFAKIADSLAPLARAALEALPAATSPTPALVRTLMAVERAECHESRVEGTPLSTMVREKPQTNRALFWSDVEFVRAASTRRDPPVRVWQVHLHGHCLWGFTMADLGWLKDDLAGRADVDDRQIALSAIVQILRAENALDASLPEWRAAISGQPLLEEDLAAYLAPPQQDAEETDFERRMVERQREQAQEEERAKQSWREFRNEIAADPGRLRDPVRLAKWSGVSDLLNLSHWLRRHTDQSDTKRAALDWQQVTAAFGQDVAEAYRDGMIRLWRLVTPERPEHREGGGITTKWANALAFAGVGIEASLSPGWTSRLTLAEAAIAARHACICEDGYPDWINALLARNPDAVLPVMRSALEAEWTEDADYPSDLLSHLAHARGSIPEVLKQPLFEIVTASDAPSIRKSELSIRILQSIELDKAARLRVASVAVTRLDSLPGDDDNRALLGLAMLFLVDAQAATGHLKAWIDTAPEPQRKSRAELALARLFGRDTSLIPAVLSALATPILFALAHFTYIRVSPQDDIDHEGSYTPDTRDEAESARNAITKALLDRPGEEAFLAVRDLADAGIAGIRQTRFRELARGKAERDSELAPWQPAQVVAFEGTYAAPIRTADDLMRVVMSLLADIQRDLVHEDASSCKLVLAAETEEQVQNWLAEQLRLRANGRFHVHREPEVADKKEPDIVISAIGAPIELAIEAKHGGKDWTVIKLEAALTQQLVTNYLRTAARRRGILVISHHGNKTWRAPEDNAVLTFGGLISRLQRLAEILGSNATGSIKVAVVGIDATLPAARADEHPQSDRRPVARIRAEREKV